MPLETFEKVLQKICDETPVDNPQIWLYNWGEPLLHPKLPEIISLIKAAGLRSYLSSNLNVEKGLRETIKAGPTELKISLSGFHKDTYSRTHTQGDINLVKSNFFRLRQYLDKYESETRVWVGHHIYKHNHHETQEVAQFCKDLGFEHHPVQAFYQPLDKLLKLSQGDDSVMQEDIMQYFLVSPAAQSQFLRQHVAPGFDGELRFNQTIINADASVAQCCSLYASETAPGTDFLRHTHAEIEQSRYQNPICNQCREAGLDVSPKVLPTSIKPG